MNSIPKNPIKQAKLLRTPTFSLKKSTAKIVIKTGAIKNIAVASANESSAIDIKKKVPLNVVKKSLFKRTLMDKNRKNSPLIRVDDAILIRTDKLTKKQVLLKMSKYIDKFNKKKK